MISKGLNHLKRKLRKSITDNGNIGYGSDGSVYHLNDSIVAKVYNGPFFYGNNKESPSNREFRILKELSNIGIPVPKPYGVFDLDEDQDVLLMERVDGVPCNETLHYNKKYMEAAENQFNDYIDNAMKSGWHPVDHGAPWDPLEFYPSNNNLLFNLNEERLYFIDVIRWHHKTEPNDYCETLGKGIMKRRLDISCYV